MPDGAENPPRLKRDTIAQIHKDVKANMAKLDSCAGPHHFVELPGSTFLDRKYECSKCGGTVRAPDYRWYMRGLSHGRLHPE